MKRHETAGASQGVDVSFHHVGRRWIGLEYRPISTSVASKAIQEDRGTEERQGARTETDVRDSDENPLINRQNAKSTDDVDAVDGTIAPVFW